MTRINLYLRSLSSSYLLLLVSTVYSLASVPIALHYLGKSMFGLWALTLQIGIVLKLADGGMAGALMRILIDYKDEKQNPDYRKTLYTVWLTFIVIAVVLYLIVFLTQSMIMGFLKIPVDLQSIFPSFLSAYMILFCLSLAGRPVALILAAHQRNDLVNMGGVISLAIAFPTLLLGFHLGYGIWAFLGAQAITFLPAICLNLWQTIRLGYLPAFRIRDSFSRSRLKEVSAYGWQRLIASLGYTLTLTMPVFLITRFLGLEATATWAVGTRIQQLALQFTSRIVDQGYPALAEMYVRNELVTLRRRFFEIVCITFGLTSIFAALMIASNSDFVHLWTAGKVAWPGEMNPLIAGLLLMFILQRLFWLPVSVAKDLGVSRYMTMCEAALALLIIWLWPRDSFSLASVAIALLAAGTLITIPVYIARGSRVIGLEARNSVIFVSRILILVISPSVLFAFLLNHYMQTSTWIGLCLKSGCVGVAALAACLAFPPLRKLLDGLFSHLTKLKRAGTTGN